MFQVLILSLQILNLFLILKGNSLPDLGNLFLQPDFPISLTLILSAPQSLHNFILINNIHFQFFLFILQNLIFLLQDFDSGFKINNSGCQTFNLDIFRIDKLIRLGLFVGELLLLDRWNNTIRAEHSA